MFLEFSQILGICQPGVRKCSHKIRIVDVPADGQCDESKVEPLNRLGLEPAGLPGLTNCAIKLGTQLQSQIQISFASLRIKYEVLSYRYLKSFAAACTEHGSSNTFKKLN